ncbi:uncharacterized protein [Antedon mediterranea]|uniref:uncharacterized protein n=1 Tax=Antedon mediterranea TaxID=105859 RepID=UPI003AF6A67C
MVSDQPTNTDLEYVSTKKWEATNDGMTTNGIVSIKTETFELPLRLDGQTVARGATTLTRIDNYKSKDTKKYDIQNFVKFNSLYRNYTRQLENVLPDWITFISVHIDPMDAKTSTSSLSLRGTEVKSIEWCSAAPVQDNGQYSVFLLYKTQLTVGGRRITLPLPPFKGKYCFIVGVSKITSGEVMVVFPEGSRDVLSYIDDINDEPSLDANVNFLAFVKSDRSGNKGDNIKIITNLQYSYYINKTISAKLKGGGDVHISLDNGKQLFSHLFIQRWVLQQFGNSKISLFWKVFGEDLKLNFSSNQENTPILNADIGDFVADKHVSQRGIVMKAPSSTDAFDNTPFSRLLKKIKGPIEVFVDYDLYPHNILQSNLDSMTETIRDLKRIVPQIKSLAKQLEASGYDGIYIDINSAVDILKENTRYYLLSDLHDLKTIGDSVNAIRIQCKRVLNILWNFDDEMSNLDIQNIDLKTDLQNVTTHFENLGNQILIEVQNIFVEESVSRSGFRMTSQLCLPSSLCFPSTKIEALYSISSCSKLHNQSISNNIDSNLPRVCITGDYLMTKNLNLFISIPFGSHFEVVFDSSKKYWFGGIQVEINLLGIQGVTTMYLATAQIHFTFSGKLWGLFDTSGNATSELSSFESMGLSVNGQVAAEGPLSLGRRLKDKIISFSQKSVDDSERRLSRASKSVETIKSKLQKALDEEVIQKSTVANAKKKHISAAEEVVVANIAVEKARELLGYTRGSMKETMATHLNKVCEIAECRVVCLPSSKIVVVKDKFLSTIPIPKKCCDKTVEDTIVDTKTSYCTTCWESTPVSHVSINPFVAAAGFALLFIHPLLGYPLLVSSIKKGKRDSYSISECCEFGMETVKIPVEFTLCSTCVSYKTITGQKDKLQLEEVPCNAQIPNSECVMQNEECRKTRNQLIDKLMGKESELASLIHQFENAGKRASVARAMLNEAQIELDDALNKQKELSYQVITLKKILQNAQDAFNKISSDVKTGLKIKEHQINGSIEESLKIKELQLNIELVGEDTFVIPIVCYMTLLSTPVNVQIIIDKNNLENTIENAAFFITEELFGNLNNIRRRRDTRHVELQTKRDTEAIIVQPPLKLVRYEVVNKSLDLNITSSLIRDPNVVQNEERCADYENILSFVEYSFLTLLEIVNSSEPANTLENEKKFQNDYLYNLSVSTPPIDVNSAALLYFNLTTIDTIAYQVDTVERDALTKMINSAKVKSKNTKLLLEIDALNQWEIEMDTYTQHCSGLVNCQGFFDCLTTEMVALKYLAEGRRSYEDIVSLDEYVSTFIDRNTNSNETETIATNVLSQVSFLKKNNDVCLEEPIITKHPEPKIITVKGEDVTLTCQATGNPSPTFTWERNGQILSGKNLNYLLLKTVKVSDSGRYTCHAHNAVTSISSLQCDVSVEFAPRITEYPQSEDIEYGNIEGAYFTCQASALPLAHYQWYFQGLYSLERKLIPGQNGSSIEILSPDFNQDGWYTCEAWNKHGGQISNTARLHVLDISMPEFSGDVTIRFYRVPNFKSTNVSLEDVIARVVSNTDPEVELLNYQEFNMKDKSFIKQISFEIKSTNATSIDILKASRNESAYQVKDKIETVVAKVTELKGLLTLGEHYEYRGELLEVIGFNSEWNGPICPNTQYAHKDGYVCVNCPPGSYRGNDSLPAVCLKCPTGFYQPNEGQTTCMECHGYTNADVGGRACTQYPTYPCSPCEKEKGTSYIPYAVGAGGGFVCFLFVVTVSRSLVKYN